MNSVETDTRFYVKESNIENAGMGLFAKEQLPVGTRLEVVGVLVDKNSPGEVCTRYARDYRFLYSEDLMLVPTGWAGMANHFPRFNSVLIKDGDLLYLEMLRDIPPNEEILYEYGPAAMLKINLQSGGQAFAVVMFNAETAVVKDVTTNMNKALKKVESLRQDLKPGWKIAMSPARIDLQELKGNL